MASIIKRKNKYSVVYYYEDERGEKRQKWETWGTYKEAQKRKTEIEHQQNEGVFIPPQELTVKDFLYDFVSLYGEKKWSMSTYDGNVSLINNYINPHIGDVPIQNIGTKFVAEYIKKLEKMDAISTIHRKPKTKFITPSTIEKIIKLLSSAFKQAALWEMIGKNPFEGANLPKKTYIPRDIWTSDMIKQALDNCEDSKLYLAMNLAFACSMREGEILGLPWANVYISDEDIANDNAHIFIDRELQRASLRAINVLDKKDIFFIFEPLLSNTSTRVVIKTPKTESSIRKVWIPKTVAHILRENKRCQEELMGFLGNDYHDHDLVVCMPNGRPCEGRILLKEFAKLREKTGLPKVVFHSLRHSSTTYKLKLNHGDLKATQGDTGHAQIDMITDIYAHILDEDRKVNAQKFEAAFYSNPDLRKVRPPQESETSANNMDLNQLIEQLVRSPELISKISQLISN